MATIKSSTRYLLTLTLLIVFFPLYAADKEKETYHILQKGFIQIRGSTNYFRFSGDSIQHSGKLEETENGFYSGEVALRFDQISFNLPLVESVLKDPEYFHTVEYPTIEIKLDRFNPHEQPSNVEGVIALHGVKKKVQIEINIFHISPLVKAEGRFNINQTDFQIRPYKLGSLEVANQLEIRFQLFFCEFHTEIPKDDTPDSQRLFEILKNEDITILREPTFFGCQELKDKQ